MSTTDAIMSIYPGYVDAILVRTKDDRVEEAYSKLTFGN